MEKDQRPVSPHLQIYSLPLSAKLSILHRISGIVLFFSLGLMVLFLFVLSLGFPYWKVIAAVLDTKISLLFFFMLTYILYYHLCNGIRHLIWDYGKYMEKKHFVISGMMVIFSSLALTILTWSA